MMKTKKLLSYLTMGVLFTGVAFADDSSVVDSYEEGAVAYGVEGLDLAKVTGDNNGDTKDKATHVSDGLTKKDVEAAEAKAKKADDTSKSSEEAVVPFGDTRRKIDVE